MPYKNREDAIENNKRFYEENSETIKARAAKWNKDNKEARKTIRMNSYWKKIGITINGVPFSYDHYNKIFDEQKGCCKICGIHQADLKVALSIDHNHDSGEARGLLCQRCNTLLGMSLDSVDTLLSAIEYLKGGNDNG